MKFLVLCAFTLLAFRGSSSRSPRMAGGKDAGIMEFPATVAIIHRSTSQLWCAGSLINKFWVLTAAHCYIELNNFLIEYATDLLADRENSKQVEPEYFIQHEQFDYRKYAYDIGLIKTKEPVVTGFHIPLSKLAIPGSYYEPGTSASAAGWDLLNITRNFLHKIELEIWSQEHCRAGLLGNPDNIQMYNHQFCAGKDDFSEIECSR